MSDTLRSGVLFLIGSLCDLYLFILGVRVVLALISADYFHPATQFIVKCTDFIVKPLRKIIPNWHDIEIATLLLMYVLLCVKFYVLAALTFGAAQLPGILILAFADLLRIFLEIYFYAILLQAIMSWVQPGSPMNALLIKITAPILRPIQRVIPVISGIDISPIFAILLLQLLLRTIVQQLLALGLGMAV